MLSFLQELVRGHSQRQERHRRGCGYPGPGAVNPGQVSAGCGRALAACLPIQTNLPLPHPLTHSLNTTPLAACPGCPACRTPLSRAHCRMMADPREVEQDYAQKGRDTVAAHGGKERRVQPCPLCASALPAACSQPAVNGCWAGPPCTVHLRPETLGGPCACLPACLPACAGSLRTMRWQMPSLTRPGATRGTRRRRGRGSRPLTAPLPASRSEAGRLAKPTGGRLLVVVARGQAALSGDAFWCDLLIPLLLQEHKT